jgi:parvin
MISPQSFDNPRLRELMVVLIEWINDELASHRIIVKDLEEDLYDGQVLHKLIGKCLNIEIVSKRLNINTSYV